MDKIFERYLNAIGYEQKYYQYFEKVCFKNTATVNACLIFKADLIVDTFIPFAPLEEFHSCVNAFKDQPKGFVSSLNFVYKKVPKKEEIKEIIDEFVEKNNYYELDNYRISTKDKTITFEYNSMIDVNQLKQKTEKLSNLLDFANCKYSVVFGFVSGVDVEDLSASFEEDYAQAEKKRLKLFKLKRDEEEKQTLLDYTYIHCSIKDAASGSLKLVEVEGIIFKSDSRTMRKNGKQITTIYFSDNSYSIISNIFESKKFDKELLEKLTVGARIRVKGQPLYDSYARQMSIKVQDVSFLEDLPLRQDTYEGEKRIELHAHTKMSAMDAIADVEDYFKAAKRFGMTAIGITDHGVVQAFPKAQDLGKINGIKVLYGSELYMVESKLNIAFNEKDIPLKEMTYTVFDLETTGLSARYDRIIEFGATKYCRGDIIDEVDFFISPKTPLSPITTKLTGITEEMVRGGKQIKQALKDILEFIGDSTLVAHNATFDFGFLNEALKNNGMEKLKNPIIDTLPLSRYMFPKIRSHNLGATARQVNADYDEDEAHRAIYDAQVLSNVWQAMSTRLLSINPEFTHKQLNDLSSDEVVLNSPHPSHVIVYAKNKKGLKDLFKLISDSNIKYFNSIPRIPKEEIDARREDLLIGSACYNGEVFEACMTKSEEVAKEVMKFYDYIEVQPPANYTFLVNDGQISSQDLVIKIIKDMISAARDLGKIIVATSDCHYIEPEDKIYRDVFVSAKGLKGARHPMNPYHRDKMKLFENPDQHFRTTNEMLKEFEFLNDPDFVKEIVITNTHKIADMLDANIKPIHDGLSAPTIDNCDVLLKERVYTNAHRYYGDKLPKIIEDRLSAEMKGISENHYEVIYWIASKIVTQAVKDGYIVGSRGSVGSSLVATMSDITEVNPLPPHYRCPNCKHSDFDVDPIYRSGFDLPDKKCPICGAQMEHLGQNIPFATFIGFHAEKTPDIDLNFPPDYQAQAHELTKTLLTKESGNHVYKAGTIESVQDKNAIGYVKGYFESLEMHPETNIKVEDISQAELLRLAQGCIGVKRTTGQHPGGIIVIPRGMEAEDFTPIQYPADKQDANWETSHFDFNSMHDTILKLDLLGHVDPMSIRIMSLYSNKNVYEIPFNDPEVMSLFSSPDALHMKENPLNFKVGTLGMPEFGTRFVMSMLEETHPKTFADLLIVSGLSHGTNVYAGNQQNLISDNIADLQGVIGCRDDIMIGLHENYGLPLDHTFDIMELVRHGRFTNPKFKKKVDKYIAEMREHNVPEYYIDSCCKIKYLFPKGHAVAYCMMGVRVGWFKIHDPLSYYASYFTCRGKQFDLASMCSGVKAILRKISEIDDEAKTRQLKPAESDLKLILMITVEMYERGYKISKLNVNKSLGTNFLIDRENNAIVPPFSTVAGIGESVAQSIEDGRKNGRYHSIEELINRTQLSHQRIEDLRELDALDNLPETDQMTLF
jgi:DNA polymerase-3 subunit alpha (Gram-positive type)